jgi:nucleotidyltransferase substrate binding protein (TIGR01987 family)
MAIDFDLRPLKTALTSLQEILAQPKDKFIVAGTIQNFEFTFELAWKAMQRLLKIRGVDAASPTQVLRAAKQEGLVDSLEMWLEFLKARNLTVHTYNQKTAEEVYLQASRFPAEVIHLLSKLDQP